MSVTAKQSRSRNALDKMDDNHVVFPRSLLKRFILTYKEHPCLWDRKSLGYKNRKLRHTAMAKLTQLVKEYDKEATVVHVMRKIESLRACVRREHKKVKDSCQCASKPEDVYKPSLWYYKLFAFVRDEDPELKLLKSKVEEDTDNEISEDEIADQDEMNCDYDEGNQQSKFQSPDIQVAESSSSNILEVAVGSHSRAVVDVEQSYKMQRKEVDDQYDAIGLIVASKLRGLQPSMRIIAEKLINDVLYQAQTNELNSSSIILTADPFKCTYVNKH